MRSRRSIARTLEAVSDFDEPRVDLEQYLTDPELAAHICHLAGLRGDLDDTTVLDLGCGTGILALGARAANATEIVGLDVDRAALDIAVGNERELFETERIEWVHGDATSPPLRLQGATVLSNPPFGAQRNNRHADRSVLETIRQLASVSYTIHNAGSLEFVESFAADSGATVTDAFESTLEVDRRFDFHSEGSKTLPVEVYRIEWPRG